MNFSIEQNHITEYKTVFDNEDRQYHLIILYSFDEECKAISALFSLIRDYRNCQVGKADCIIQESGDILLADILIYDNLNFLTINDKFYRLLNWREPINYQKRGLGTILLTHVIEFAQSRKAKKMYGSLTEQDISKNPKLINWFERHNFKIESPTSEEVSSASYRACLYLED